MKKNNVMITSLFVLISVSIVLNACDTATQASTIPESLALDLALSDSRDNGLGGWVTPPKKAYGQVMTYTEAIQFVLSKHIEPNTKQYEKRNKLVWLIVLEGEFLEHVPQSAGGDIPATEIIHTQMAIILDGKTGEIMRRILPPSHIKLPVTNLPILEKADGVLPVMPTGVPILTEVPYPTLEPAFTPTP